MLSHNDDERGEAEVGARQGSAFILAGFGDDEQPWLEAAVDVLNGKNVPPGGTQGGADGRLAPVGEVPRQINLRLCPCLAIALLEGERQHACIGYSTPRPLEDVEEFIPDKCKSTALASTA